MIIESEVTINSLANDLEIPQPVLHRFVKGDRPNVSADTMEKIAAFYGLNFTKPRKLF